MYDELVKRLRKVEEMLNVAQFKEAANLIEQSVDAIEELSKPRWIPVTERLPEEKTYVLILADTIAGKMQIVSLLYKDGEGRNCWTALDEYGKNPFDWQPTHWMPLPAAPKEEDDEGGKRRCR
jgi:hypothetical protein